MILSYYLFKNLDVKNLCTPSKMFFYLSVFVYVLLVIQNYQDGYSYRIGLFEIQLENHKFFYFIYKLLYIFLTTIILDTLCKYNYTKVSWALFAIPLISFIIFLATVYSIKM